MRISDWSSDVCSSDLTRVYYNVFPREDASNYAEVFVQLKAYDAQRTPLFLDRLRARFNAIPGAEIIVKEFENGPPIEAPIALRVIGPDLATLRDIAAREIGRAHV